MSAFRWAIKLCTILFLSSSASLVCTCDAQVEKAANAKDVCSFVTKEMTSNVPQVPTLCVPKRENDVDFELSVFSPTDVLEGKMRRAWSTALFIVFSELYFDNSLNGKCKRSQSSWFGCVFLISDSYLSQHGGKQYRLFDPTTPDGLSNNPIHGDPSSDDWYRSWWHLLDFDPQFSRLGTPENAKSIAEGACTKYIAALKRDPIATSQPDMMPIPACSVLLVTGSRADMIVNFSNWLTPAFSEYARFLLETFGESFDGTPYAGEIIFRSAWDSTVTGKTMRSNWSYDLRDLEFDWEELKSGVRPDAAFDATMHTTTGQTDLHSLSDGAAGGIVLKVVDAPGRGKIMDLTNGSEWLISEDADSQPKCTINPGLQVVMTTKGMITIGEPCEPFKATFAGGW